MSLKTPSTRLVNPPLLASTTSGRELDLETLFFIRAISGLAWSAESSQLFFETNITGRYNLWRVAARGGWPMQLTVCEERTTLVQISPDGRYLCYTQDQDGNEKPNVFLMDPTGGRPYALTRTEGIGYRSIRISPDGTRVAYAAELEGKGQYGIYVTALPERLSDLADALPAPELVIPSDGYMYGSCTWSRCGRFLAVTRSRDAAHTGICVIELDGTLHEVLPIHEEFETEVVGWSPDGTRLLVNSNMAPSGQMAPALVHVETGHLEWLVDSPWEALAHEWSPDGRSMAWTLNEAGSETLCLMDMRSRLSEPVALPGGTFSEVHFSPDSSRLAFHFGAADRPMDIWVMNLEGGVVYQVTNAFVGGLEAEDLVRPHLVAYPAEDGTPISAFLYLPPGTKEDGGNPAVVMIRGGPTAQTRNRYSRDIQYLVSRGFVVIAPNYRGSTGFGRDFQESNRLDMGGGDLRDVVAARTFLVESELADPRRVAVMGGSYGGYLTLMAVTRYPDLWAAAVAVVPFANWFTEYENEDEVLQKFDRMMMGDPVENREFWIDRSPYFFVDRIRTPLLMLAGENDIRCPASETREIAQKILDQGGTVEFKIYENEGHGFIKRENSIDAFTRTVDFLMRHL